MSKVVSSCVPAEYQETTGVVVVVVLPSLPACVSLWEPLVGHCVL